jgi:hypothetical protein
MSDRSPAPSERPLSADLRPQSPPPDAVEFIRFCYRRRHVGWPELYDEMCAVAARREFNGWDHEQLAERGLTFSLYEMPRLAAWVRAVIGPQRSGAEADHRPMPRAAVGTA